MINYYKLKLVLIDIILLNKQKIYFMNILFMIQILKKEISFRKSKNFLFRIMDVKREEIMKVAEDYLYQSVEKG